MEGRREAAVLFQTLVSLTTRVALGVPHTYDEVKWWISHLLYAPDLLQSKTSIAKPVHTARLLRCLVMSCSIVVSIGPQAHQLWAAAGY